MTPALVRGPAPREGVQLSGARGLLDRPEAVLTVDPGAVASRPADDPVAALASVQDVGSGLSEEGVVPRVAPDAVVARTTADHVVAAQAADPVIAAEAADDVAPPRSAQDVALRAAPDRAARARSVAHAGGGCR